MQDTVYAHEKKPLKNPFSHNKSKNSSSNNRKHLSTPFGVPNNHENSEYSDLNVLDQSPNQSPALRNPYEQESDNYGYEDSQLEGNISLEPQSEYNQKAPEKSRQAQRNTQSQHDFIAVGPTSDQPYEPSFIKNNSIMNSVIGFAGLFGANTGKGNPQAQEYDEENEPPLLEDLGIDLKLIKMRTLSVLKFEKCQEEFVREADMSGPLLLVLIFGMLLLLRGKVHFGHIYGFSMIGTIAVYILVNLLSQGARVQLYNTMSILGYCLFPVVLLAAFNILFSLVNFIGFFLCLGAICWATLAARNFFQVLLNMGDQKWLIAYPIFLFYFVFVLITIF